MTLREYLKSNGISDADFAATMGGCVTERAVRKWRYGETMPRLPEAVRIEVVTDGKVKPDDFVTSPEQPPEAA